MKKQLLMALFVAGSLGIAQAQTNILTEDFEGGSVPAGWSNYYSGNRWWLGRW